MRVRLDEPATVNANRDIVRTIGRIAEILLELRGDYDRRPDMETAALIRQWIGTLDSLAAKLKDGQTATSDLQGSKHGLLGTLRSA